MKKILATILTLVFTMAIAVCCSLRISYAQFGESSNCHQSQDIKEVDSQEKLADLSCDEEVVFQDADEVSEVKATQSVNHLFRIYSKTIDSTKEYIPKSNSPPFNSYTKKYLTSMRV